MKTIFCVLLLAMACVAEEKDTEEKKKWNIVYVPTGDMVLDSEEEFEGPLGGRLSPSTSNNTDDLKLNIDMYDKFVNRNPEDLNRLKTVFDMIPIFQKAVHYSSDGFECNEKLCEQFGTGTVVSLGLCSQYYCNCTQLGPQDRQCTGYYAYDPVYKMCDVPTKIKICV